MNKSERNNEELSIKIELKETDSMFVELKEVKNMLSLGTSVYKFIVENNIPYLRTGSKYKVHRKSFYRWIENNLIYSKNVKSYDIGDIVKESDVQRGMEIIETKHDDILLLLANNLEKKIELNVKKDTVFKVKNDCNIKKILDHYEGLNYKIIIHESNDESQINFIENEIMKEFNRDQLMRSRNEESHIFKPRKHEDDKQKAP